MSDHASATIRIGGSITKYALESLVGVCKGATLEMAGRSAQEWDFENASRWERSIVLYDVEAAYGEFHDIEVFCRDNDLTYKRTNDPNQGIEGSIVFWKPGMTSPCRTLADVNGEPHLSLDSLKTYLFAGMTLAMIIENAESLMGPVPPLKIVD